MRARLHAAVTLTGVLLISACSSLRSDNDTAPGGGLSMDDGAIVLAGVALRDGRGDVLNAMVGKVPNFRLQRVRERCPQITLRNAVSFQSLVNPHVYVDGVRATDTCILDDMQTADVRRVEVYPTGVTNRPGYGRHAHGLILIFMRDA